MDEHMIEGPVAPQSIAAVLADVDGTLVTSAKVVTKRAIEAVRRLHEIGIAFFITSGRPPRGMRMLVEPLALKAPMAAFTSWTFREIARRPQRLCPDLPPELSRQTGQGRRAGLWQRSARRP